MSVEQFEWLTCREGKIHAIYSFSEEEVSLVKNTYIMDKLWMI